MKLLSEETGRVFSKFHLLEIVWGASSSEVETNVVEATITNLRKRYGESNRPQLELDYIERLLKGF